LDFCLMFENIDKYMNLYWGNMIIKDFPPNQKQETLKLLNISFSELMIENKLKDLLDLTCIGGLSTYSLAYNIPALLGLWVFDPISVESYLQAKFSSSVKPLQLCKYGWGKLWENIVIKDNIKITHDVEILSIQRSLNNPEIPITIKTKNSREPIRCDFLIFAAPMNVSFLPIVKDVTKFEKEICSSYTNSEMFVTLFKTEKKQNVQLKIW